VTSLRVPPAPPEWLAAVTPLALVQRAGRGVLDLGRQGAWFLLLAVVVGGYYLLPHAAFPVVVLVALGGGYATAQRHQAHRADWWRCGLLALAATDACGLLWYFGHGRLTVLLGLLALQGFLQAPRADVDTDRQEPWSQGRLLDALVGAGVLPRLRAGDPAYRLGYRGKPQTDEFGTAVVVELPDVALWTDVQSKSERVARMLRIPARSFHVEHGGGHDGLVRLWFGSSEKPAPAPTPTGDTDWRDGVLIGRDVQGNDAVLPTGQHTAIVGFTGSGKTRLARVVAATALLDVDGVDGCYFLDGNDEDNDWAAVAGVPGVRHYGGADTDRIRACLSDLERLQDERRDPAKRTGDYVVFVDEWYTIRMKAAGKARDEITERFSAILSTMRKRRMRAVFIVQRGTVEYLPGDLKGNIRQRLVGMVADPKEVGYVIPAKAGSLPAAPGEFLFTLNQGGTASLVTVPDFTDEQWEQACAHAARLRGAAQAVLPAADAHAPALTLVKEAPRNEFADAVVAVLEDHPGGMNATAVLGELPERHAMPVNQLGRRLAELARREVIVRGRGDARNVAYFPAARPAAVPARVPAGVGTGAAPHAQKGPASAVPALPTRLKEALP